MQVTIYFQTLIIVGVAAFGTWILSLHKHDVSIVDSLWPLMFILLGFGDAAIGHHWGSRSVLILGLVTVWGLRLAIYITWRNWGHGEDRRYAAIRSRNQPNFSIKSLYLVFALQSVLAWLISLPLHAAIALDASRNPVSNGSDLGLTDAIGTAVWLLGFIFEAGGDWQLARFKSNPVNRGKVMDRGLWRYTRHPNYFGDFAIWWGIYIIAAGAGAWWSILGPLVMSVLLMRISGVTLLEKDIGARRPEYAEYARRTNAFFPGMVRRP